MDSIMLLAMSTLNTKRNGKDEELINNKFIYKSGEEDTQVEECKGQLEPIVKYWIRQFPNKKTRILMLCTEDTLTDQNNYYHLTAVEFFKERIREFCRTHNLNNAEQKDFFYIINLNENEPNPGIRDAAQHIRENKGENTKLWIDTHGGFREVTLVMEAIASLLKVDGIEPEKILGVQFGKVKRIVDQQKSFDVFNFVAGMNEFINYGRVNMLQAYYEKRGDKNSTEQILLEAMKAVSDGAEESDPKKYEDGLDALGEAVKQIGTTDTLLQIFKEYVVRSYGDLLNKETRTAIGIIKRCKEKGQYQQALVFIDTLMPDEFWKHHILYADHNAVESLKKDMGNENPNNNQYTSNEKLVFDAYISNNNYIKYYRTDGKEDEALLISKVKDNEDGSYSFLWNRNTKNAVSQIPLVRGNVRKNKPDRYFVDIRTDLNRADYAMAGRIMAYHRALKTSRNKFAHSNPDRAKMSDIVFLMGEYIDKVCELFKKYSVKR